MSQFQSAHVHTHVHIYHPRNILSPRLRRKNRTRTNDQVNKIIISTGKPFIQIYSRFRRFIYAERETRAVDSRFKKPGLIAESSSGYRSRDREFVSIPSRRQTESSPKERRRCSSLQVRSRSDCARWDKCGYYRIFQHQKQHLLVYFPMCIMCIMYFIRRTSLCLALLALQFPS